MPATKSDQIGFKQAGLICQMDARRRLDFIAEGLPMIYASAKSLLDAAKALEGFPREAEILTGHAVEECAKILILIDLVRCPAKRAPARVGPMMSWYYNHLARLIYAEAQNYKPVSLAQLQEYVDYDRPSHYVDGDYGEFIMPNMKLFSRESALYADVIGNDDADPTWSSPLNTVVPFFRFDPQPWRIVDALEAFGLLTRPGLDVLQRTWGKVHFTGDIDWFATQPLYDAMAKACEQGGLLTERLNDDHPRALYAGWQMPMYELDFSTIKVPLEDLKAQQEAYLWSQI